MYSIHVVLYTYKGTNLFEAVNAIYSKASNEAYISMVIYDQHPLDRKSKFEKRDHFSYEHIFWDHQYTPINYKKKEVLLSSADYTLSISADVTVKDNWDVGLVNYIKSNNNILISGMGMSDLRLHDKYFIKNYWGSSGSFGAFSLSNYIDRNFLFGPSVLLKSLNFPTNMKYFGEEEMMSISAFKNSIDIFSCPTGYYSDNYERNLETIYAPFSIEHHYNDFVDYINNPGSDDIIAIENFFRFHNVDYKKIKKIPYQVDDVLYDPNTLKIVSIGGERFIDSVKVIY